MLDPMAQEEEIGQEMLVVEGEQLIPPQMDLEPEMGAAAAAAAVYDTSPSPPHQNPSPIPAETAQQGTFDMAQLVAILAAMRGDAQRMEANLKANTNEMKEETKGMREEMKEMRGEMQNMGAGLQDGLGQLKIGNGERRRATCRGRRVEVTETVTETLNGVTETCTRETRHQVTELTETREVVERLHGVEVKDAHTHTHR